MNKTNSSPSSPSQTRRGAFEKFRQKIRRSKSVSFPATEPESEQHHAADGRERRRANRDRLEEPAQGASPLFKRWGCGRRPSLDLIAVAGMMIAAGELDRLSLRADDVERVRRGEGGGGGQMSPPGSGDGNGSGGGVVVVPPNTPNTAVGSPASPVSPGGGVGDSSIMGRQLGSALSAERREGGFAPFPPANTPVFGGSGAVTPSSRSGSGLGLGGGKQRAARPSKLSEVRRFEEVVRRLSVSDSAVSPGARETEEEPVYRLESFPEFPDGGDHSEDRYESGESTPRYKPGEHYFVEGGLQSGAGVGGSGLKLRGQGDCEEVEGEHKGEETHARPDIWRPEDGVGSGPGEVSSTRDSKGSRLSFATSEERRRSWLDVARRATKGRWDHELEECRGLTEEEEGDGKEGLVMKRKHTMADIVELLRSGKGVQKE
ncbi:hypothetical protein QC764_509545 [Podospora pseudoanserina]|uniref:Uncharacterized protein n=1 Tax=Podospora pseudoanserina TaxID=2609844 RepID=A0ABR0I8D8_9PEZI|nr:hypothetical protein QC764_509545 [Podospora pseudoanserina]